MSQENEIAEVLEGFTPVGEDHPAAQETREAVKEMLEARKNLREAEVELHELQGELLSSEIDVSDVNVIKPGDTVLFASRGPITQKRMEEIKAALQIELPGVNPVIMDGLTVQGIYRPEKEE